MYLCCSCAEKALLHWQTLTIVLRGDGFKNRNQLCVVSHFYSEAVLCVSHTFPSYRDGRLFCSNGVQSWWVGGKLCHRTLSRFRSLLVERARAAGREVRLGMSWLCTKASSAGQDRAAHMLSPCLRQWVDDLYLQECTVQGIRKYYIFIQQCMNECYSTDLTCLEEAELHRVLWLIWLPVLDNCWFFGSWFWFKKLCEPFLKVGTKGFGAAAELCVPLCWARVAASELTLCLGGCTCTEVPLKPTDICLLLLVVCPSLWALLSKAFRLFSSIIRCCSAVSWLDMMQQLTLTR